MNIINNGNSFLLLKYRLTFAAGIKNKIDVMNAQDYAKLVNEAYTNDGLN